MKAKKIYPSDVKDLLVSSLPSRPTAPRALGGRGFSADDMKAAFDKLPLYVIERYNALIDDVRDLGDESLAAAIPTGIREGHMLASLFSDVESGELATYFSFLGKSLFSHMIGIYGEIDALKSEIAELKKEKEVEKT